MMLAKVRALAKDHWPRWLLGAAIVIYVGMMGSLFWGYLDPLFNNSDLERQGLDFFSIYEAGHRAIEKGSVYGGLFEPVTPYSTFYRYLPLFAYVFGAPANLIPPWWAYWAWVAFYELLLVATAYATWRMAGRGTWGFVAASMWFVFSPFYQAQYFGPFSFLLGVALFWVGVGVVRAAQSTATVPWAVSLVTKSNSALLGPLFLRIGWWRVLIGGGIAVAINLPYFLWRPADWDFFYNSNFGGLFQSTQRFFAYIPGDLGGPAFVRNVYFLLDSGAKEVP